MDLLAFRENTHCPLWCPILYYNPPLRVDALVHLWPLTLRRMRVERHTMILIAPYRSTVLVPLWNFVLVLRALSSVPCKPLSDIDLKLLSLKTALLLALEPAKHVGDLTALSVNPACMQFAPWDTSVILRPNPFHLPKDLTSSFRSQVIDLPALDLPILQSESELNCIWWVAGRGYMLGIQISPGTASEGHESPFVRHEPHGKACLFGMCVSGQAGPVGTLFAYLYSLDVTCMAVTCSVDEGLQQSCVSCSPSENNGYFQNLTCFGSPLKFGQIHLLWSRLSLAN